MVGLAYDFSLIEEKAAMSEMVSGRLALSAGSLDEAAGFLCRPGTGSYPPYDILQTGEHSLRLTLAVAGFSLDDLAVTAAGRQLMVRGRRRQDAARPVFLHRGIALRQFQRSFLLIDGFEAKGAWLADGLLNIDLERPAVRAPARALAVEQPVQSGGQRAS